MILEGLIGTVNSSREARKIGIPVVNIRLEALNDSHIPAILEACRDWRELARYGNPYWRPRSSAELLRKISSMSGPQPATEYNYVIVDELYGRAVGECSLHGIDWRNRNAQVGVCIWSLGDRGQGYGRESIVQLMNWAVSFLGLARLEAQILNDNVYSRRLFESLGFTLEGVAKRALLVDGVRHDMNRLSFLVE